MKPLLTLLVTGSLVVALSGCTAYKHNKAGNAAMETGDMRSAVYHYERAMAHKEGYARDEDFLEKLAVARARVAYDDARKLRAEGRYEQALEQLREATRQDPDFAKPKELLTIVLGEASQWRYTRAVAAADQGDLGSAREHLMRSMQHDMTNDLSAYAMASLTPDTMQADTPGLAEYREGLTQAAEKRWLQAEQTQLKSIAANTGLLPARAALHDARSNLKESRRLQRDGQALIDQLTMGPAIKSLNQSLAIWPFNERADELLTHASTQQALADEQFAKSTQAAGQTRWDDAIALADAGLAIDRSHRGLGDLRSALPRRAAADYTHRGDGHLEKDELEKAHQSYTRALSYRDNYHEARLGLAIIYAKWAEQEEKAGRLGAALLNYQKGQSYTRSKIVDEGVVRMRAAVRDRLSLGLAVSADERHRGEISPRQLKSALLSKLQSARSRGVALQDNAPYALRLSIANSTIDERRTNSSRRTQHYTTQEYRHNDEYDRIASKLRHEESALRGIESRLSGFRCRGHKDKSPCDCFSSSRYNSLKSSANRQRRVVDSLRHKLSCTPHQIKVTLHHEWPYTVETYTKTGELKVVTELIDLSTGKPVKSFTHQASFAQSDDRTLNANPSVGVREDRLHLAGDDEVRHTLTDELTRSAGPWALNAMVDHRLAQINASIKALDNDGQTEEALEARVDAAVLLGVVDSKASGQSMDKLTQSYTR
jgi:tetratricopeptide (TPR) repeat protein